MVDAGEQIVAVERQAELAATDATRSPPLHAI
jgi:hypothetical protein